MKDTCKTDFKHTLQSSLLRNECCFQLHKSNACSDQVLGCSHKLRGACGADSNAGHSQYYSLLSEKAHAQIAHYTIAYILHNCTYYENTKLVLVLLTTQREGACTLHNSMYCTTAHIMRTLNQHWNYTLLSEKAHAHYLTAYMQYIYCKGTYNSHCIMSIKSTLISTRHNIAHFFLIIVLLRSFIYGSKFISIDCEQEKKTTTTTRAAQMTSEFLLW